MEIIAGVDFGSTLTKAYWRAHDGRERLMTVTLADQCVLAYEMAREGVRRVRRTGIGQADDAITKRFEIIGAPADAVDDEITLQAAGARLLFERSLAMPPPKKMLIVAIGTGVSYTKVSGKKAKRSPLGSAHGGGTILGLGRLVGAKTFEELEAGAAKGTPADLLVKHQLPATDGTPLGDLVIAHFTKEDASFEDRCASVFSFAAASIAKDLAVLSAIPFSPKEFVVVGRIGASPTFRQYLQRWLPMLKGCLMHFPKNGEYAAATGAWAAISE